MADCPNPFGLTALSLVEVTDLEVPRGVIVIWNWQLGAVPVGWHVCDGTNGTPLINNRFIRAANVANPPGSLGGAFQHNHVFTSEDHSHDREDGSDFRSLEPMNSVMSQETVSGTTGVNSDVTRFITMDFIMKL